ncbi:hypothetical protein BKM03_17120 [Pseudomonas avellanae]|uniref:Uncharacterized protein n=1 Tax=Pseudomonas avellanae TaxID=46257 RepID=A0AAD0DRL2_9PSED|nr:hypothetical protein BKM03_17120 [Pseudomonas avellanae]POP83672.1 hypothetical protein CXB34_21845 [Pseudomonas amygdali pv. morsprunorum]
MARCSGPRISVRAKEPDEVGPETEPGLCLLWSLKVGRRGAKRCLEPGTYPTDIAEPLCDAQRHKEDAERPERHATRSAAR